MKINQKIVFSSSSLLSALVKKPTLATRIARHHRRALTRALESARNILESFRWREPKWQDLPRGEGEEETLKRENKRCERTERGRSRWFDVPTVFTRKQTRECCHFEIFPKILEHPCIRICAKWRIILLRSLYL